MTLRGRLLALFPAVVIAVALGAVLSLGAWGLPVAALALYGLPPLAFRVHQVLCPVREGPSHLVGEGYSPWYGGHQLQLLYTALPALEAVLRLVPGLYSAWLRTWGAKVGRGVHWTPRVQILDRALVEIGDRVIFGHEVVLLSHVIKPTKRGNLLLFVKRIRIGDGVLLGAGCHLGPGVVVDPGVMVPVTEDVFPNTHLTAG